MQKIKAIEKRLNVINIPESKKYEFYSQEVEGNKEMYLRLQKIRTLAHHEETGDKKTFNEKKYLKDWEKIKHRIVMQMIEEEKNPPDRKYGMEYLKEIQERVLGPGAIN